MASMGGMEGMGMGPDIIQFARSAIVRHGETA
jgi:hypothetical protein